MARRYTVEFENETIFWGTDYDYFTHSPGDERARRLTTLVVDIISELGNAQEEHIRLRIVHGGDYSSGGAAVTPRPHDPNDAAAGGAWETLNSYTPGLGAGYYAFSDGFNARLGYRRAFYQNNYWSYLHVRQPAGTSIDDVSASATLSFIETPF